MADNETVAWRLTVHGVFVSQMNFVSGGTRWLLKATSLE